MPLAKSPMPLAFGPPQGKSIEAKVVVRNVVTAIFNTPDCPLFIGLIRSIVNPSAAAGKHSFQAANQPIVL
jgi:hypothetical protein